MESILNSIKSILGIQLDDLSFDTELIIAINSIFSIMSQIGTQTFAIQDSTATWNTFFGNRTDLEFIKTYIGMKVKLDFDPPQNSFLVDNIRKQCEEMEWRISVLN